MSEILRDYRSASKVFVSNGFENAPKYKFLFHVFFELNVGENKNFGLNVKTVKLPGFNTVTSTLNQYNRTRIVMQKIKYTPVDITFHDDYGDKIRGLWLAYYMHHFNDSAKGLSGDVNTRSIYSPSAELGWGYTGPSTPFLKSIKIYSFHGNNQQSTCELINPIITRFDHDTHSYSEPSGIMENKMSVDYESVVYDNGSAADAIGFGEAANYDL